MSTLIDLSHTITNGMTTYKGLPAPIICDYWTFESSAPLYEEGTSFQISKIEMVANTGTYLDCPSHRYANGKDLSQIVLEKVVDIPAILINAQHTQAIDASFFKNKDLFGKAVLVFTNWSEHWGTDQYYQNNPFLTQDAAEYLVNNGAKLVGIDSHNIDDVSTNRRPVHSILLQHEILIVEHLCNLKELESITEFTFTAAPPKIEKMGTFPVRAFAKVVQN